VVTVDEFYATVPRFERFEDVTDASLYRPLPDDWVVGVSDVVSSTRAIASGQYKSVNLAGAAMIPALANRLGNYRFPYVFGGDGAALALPGDQRVVLEQALSDTAAFARDALGLQLRVSVMTMATIREAGHDVRLARFARSTHIDYAMFAGGGVSYAVERMKADIGCLQASLPGIKPDLEGLTCRWHPMPAEHGVVLSLIVLPGRTISAFNHLLSRLFALLRGEGDAGEPLSNERLHLPLPLRGLMFEARALRRPGTSLWRSVIERVYAHFVSFALFRTGIVAGSFDPARYRRELVANADTAKFEDGLRMTIDCSPAVADALDAMLTTAEAEGGVRFGSHRQTAAIMTCLVPSIDEADHAHFIDGADGGYAMAAQVMKDKHT